MISVKKCSADLLVESKKQYIQQTTAPLDGMWLCGFLPMSVHFGLYLGDKRAGYCCLNEEGYLLQFYVEPEYSRDSTRFFNLVMGESASVTGKVNGAFVSTAEPIYLSHCLDMFSSYEVNTHMYEYNLADQHQGDSGPKLHLEALTGTQLDKAVDFAHRAIGAPTAWLSGYYQNLIEREELFGYWQDETLLATGEIRSNAIYHNTNVDVGMIVAESQRGKGIATEVLKILVSMAKSRGVAPICSTEDDNIGAQKAILNAGFLSANRILQFNNP